MALNKEVNDVHRRMDATAIEREFFVFLWLLITGQVSELFCTISRCLQKTIVLAKRAAVPPSGS